MLDTCVSSTLIYGCEAWGIANIPQIETIYRSGLKRALSVRESINTEIVYLESGCNPLSARIAKQQLSFWKSIQLQINNDPAHPLRKLLDQAVNLNIKFVKYYQNLEARYHTPLNCQRSLTTAFINDCKEKICTCDEDSKLGVYCSINPELKTPEQDICVFEKDRISVSRYRCGSHYLKIESGRMCNPSIPREDRICNCNTGIQTLRHCLFSCPLLDALRSEYNFTTIDEAMKSKYIAAFIAKMEIILNISN